LERRERVFELLEAPKKAIVEPVGDRRIIFYVIAIIVKIDRLAKQLGLLFGLLPRELPDIFEFAVGTLDIRIVRAHLGPLGSLPA
jgi:hypothetical protein